MAANSNARNLPAVWAIKHFRSLRLKLVDLRNMA